jgi:hypothetical protein
MSLGAPMAWSGRSCSRHGYTAGLHAAHLASGYLFFLPILGSEPIMWRVPMAGRYLMLLVTMSVDTAAGVLLMLYPRELFPAYARAGRAWGPSVQANLHNVGMIMWIGSDIIMTVVALAVAAAFIHDPGQAGQLGRWVEGIRRAAPATGNAGRKDVRSGNSRHRRFRASGGLQHLPQRTGRHVTAHGRGGHPAWRLSAAAAKRPSAQGRKTVRRNPVSPCPAPSLRRGAGQPWPLRAPPI